MIQYAAVKRRETEVHISKPGLPEISVFNGGSVVKHSWQSDFESIFVFFLLPNFMQINVPNIGLYFHAPSKSNKRRKRN